MTDRLGPVLLLGAALVFVPGASGAETYRWVDDQGNVTYSNRPPQPREVVTPTPEAKPATDVKTPEVKAPDVRTPEVRAPEMKAPETKASDAKTPDVKGPEVKAPEPKIRDARVSPPTLAIPNAMSSEVSDRTAVTVLGGMP